MSSAGTPWWIRGLRIAFAVLAIVALVWIPIRSIDDPYYSMTNFFSYFTIEANILGVIVLLVGGLRDPAGRGWQALRGAATLYLLITGIVYAVLLADVDVMLTDRWINIVLHRLIPIVIVADWLLIASGLRLSARLIGGWLVFPFVYGVYTLIRGPIVDWYPYPFIDPRNQGYGKLTIGLIVMFALFALLAALVAAMSGAVPRLIGRGESRSPAS
ncbi:Pr6Pr family membrane protein [Nocardia jejuensis]|uniref:Pr6Pr family membrane protein n=1 Tax=Nocardia jejuensis TaxID=328049 RepID=UPI00082F42F7|nr:Pr6Pr family membrane protein [Nocardia jejuensis]